MRLENRRRSTHDANRELTYTVRKLDHWNERLDLYDSHLLRIKWGQNSWIKLETSWNRLSADAKTAGICDYITDIRVTAVIRLARSEVEIAQQMHDMTTCHRSTPMFIDNIIRCCWRWSVLRKWQRRKVDNMHWYKPPYEPLHADAEGGKVVDEAGWDRQVAHYAADQLDASRLKELLGCLVCVESSDLTKFPLASKAENVYFALTLFIKSRGAK